MMGWNIAVKTHWIIVQTDSRLGCIPQTWGYSMMVISRRGRVKVGYDANDGRRVKKRLTAKEVDPNRSC